MNNSITRYFVFLYTSSSCLISLVSRTDADRNQQRARDVKRGPALLMIAVILVVLLLMLCFLICCRFFFFFFNACCNYRPPYIFG